VWRWETRNVATPSTVPECPQSTVPAPEAAGKQNPCSIAAGMQEGTSYLEAAEVLYRSVRIPMVLAPTAAIQSQVRAGTAPVPVRTATPHITSSPDHSALRFLQQLYC